MTDTAMRLTLREMRKRFSSPRAWAVMVAIALLLGLSGPFETAEFLRLGPRIGYWLLVVVATFAAGLFIHTLLSQGPAEPSAPNWTQVARAGIVTGIAVAFVLLLINWVALNLSPFQAGYAFWLALNAVIISLLVSVISTIMHGELKSPSEGPAAAQGPRLLQRLDFDKRGSLISLSVQDHYVDVVTSAGASLLLMRLSDAIAETEGVAGLQVHRSHWVALKAVTSARRCGDKAVLTLSDGRDIPVSRTYLKTIRDAGLLPG